ncbi:MAG: LD-carboxypeptidase, partial [Spirochaetales bacterium]|nr:LD-carboxypeptidase [Spirochaetales bacterium]
MLEKPRHLERGDTVATVSLSWGGAGDPELLWRYEVGKKRLEDVFGLRVVEMEHT